MSGALVQRRRTGEPRGVWTFLLASAFSAPLDIPELSAEEVRIDGQIDEATWDRAALVTDFSKYQPNAGGPPGGTTEVRIFHDDKALYFAIRVRDAEAPIRARVSPREAINADDQIGLYLDPFSEGNSGYIFYFNSIGIQQDMRVLAGNPNFRWDTVFKSKGTVVGENGYDLEVAMPFRSLKYANTDDKQEWRLIVTRKIPGEGAKYSWPVIERNAVRIFSQGAPIVLDPPDGGSGLEVRGELAVLQQQARDEADQLAWSGLGTQAVRPGLDVKYGITSNLGVSATLNPDFSQVENDETPIDINQRFAFNFEERRPFFLEGSGFFQDQNRSLYSRSIVNPLYGVKLTGREGRTSTGVLHALDRSPGASVHQYGAPGFSEADVQDAVASNSMGRLAYDVLDGGHASVTLADKRLFGEDGLRGSHESMQAQLFTPLGGRWSFSGSTVHSLTDSPDAERSLYGHQGKVSIERKAAEGFGTMGWVESSTPGLRQEMGFRTQSGFFESGGSVSWTFEPGGAIDTLTPSAFGMVWEDDEGDRFRMAEVQTKGVFGGVYEATAEFGVSEFVEDGLLVPGRWVDLSAEGVFTSWLTMEGDLGLSRTIDWRTLSQANRVEGSLETTLRPTAGLRLDTKIRHDRIRPEAGSVRWASSVRTKLTWQFTPALGVRLIEQHVLDSEEAPLLTSSLLMTWLRSPGTAVYVGYAETTDFEDGPKATNRTVFAKGTWLLRL